MQVDWLESFIAESVLSGRAHIGIAPLDLIPKGLDAHLFRRVGQVTIVQVTHPIASKSRIGLAALSLHKLILSPPDWPHRKAVVLSMRKLGKTLEVAVEASA
ncbi:MAG: hypothetical protein ACI841_000252 [Planctomycetota bacterium]|jgi:hypothetical protein